MKVCNDLDTLLDVIASRIEKSMRQDVAPVISDMLANSAASTAAGPWSRIATGISDKNNIVSEVSVQSNSAEKTITLFVKDVAEPSTPLWGTFDQGKNNAVGGTMFSQWIENGEWMDLATFINSGYTDKTKRPARKFVQNVQDKLDSNPNIVLRALQRGLF